MSIQDDAFDIQRAIHQRRGKNRTYIIHSWEHFRDWAYELEKENERLRSHLHAFKKVVAVHRHCLCGKPLPKTSKQFCEQCVKLPRDCYGLPIRKR